MAEVGYLDDFRSSSWIIAIVTVDRLGFGSGTGILGLAGIRGHLLSSGGHPTASGQMVTVSEPLCIRGPLHAPRKWNQRPETENSASTCREP